jgi:hypothetical protein
LSLARRFLLPGLILGAVVRAIALPLPGTEDVSAFKIWTYNATHDPTSVYGVGGSPPTLRALHWREWENIANYPPLIFDELGAAGRLYRLYSPDFADSDWFTVTIKLAPLLAELVWVGLFLTWGRRRFGPDVAATLVLVYWLNPAVIMDGAVLGYLDLPMAVPTTLSLVAVFADAPGLAGGLLAAAILTKPQPVFVAPIIVAALFARRTLPVSRSLMRFAAAGAGTAAVILAPVIIRGAFWNMWAGVRRLAMYDMVSAQAANVWWLFTYVLRVKDVWHEWGPANAIMQRLRILAITRVTDLGYPNPRVVAFVLVGAAIVAAGWRARRAPSLAVAAALAGWTAWASAVFAAQAHENHLFLAVSLFSLAAGLDRRFRAVCWTVSIVAAINVYLFGGFGLTYPPIDRSVTFIDASVLLAVVNVGAFVWFTLTAQTGGRLEAFKPSGLPVDTPSA